MTDTDPPDDVNEVVTAEWKEETTPFERVRSVIRRTYTPQSADEVADRAQTTPTTARKHLQQLTESGFVETVSKPERTATLYKRSNESLVLEQAHDILREIDTDELVMRITEMQDEIQAYRDELGVDSPEDAALQDVDHDGETLRDWQTTRRNLGIAKAALALSQAEETMELTQAV
jgi:Fe2+ or Zn2+ uptake regulation protein